MCFQVEPFASLVTLSRHSVPRLLFNREMVGPFRSSRCRHTDVTVRGDVVESVRVLVQGAGWEVELEDIQRTVSKDMRLHAAGACMSQQFFFEKGLDLRFALSCFLSCTLLSLEIGIIDGLITLAFSFMISPVHQVEMLALLCIVFVWVI